MHEVFQCERIKFPAAVSTRSERSEGSSVMAGIAYGLTVWALAYGVGLPSLGLHPAATDDTKDRKLKPFL
jgi:hypothetical protein